MSTRRRRAATLPPPEAREFLDALAAMLADAVRRDEAEAEKNRAVTARPRRGKSEGGEHARHTSR